MTPPGELPTYTPVLAATPARHESALPAVARDRLIARAKALSWLSLAWMTVEGAVGITAGVAAGSVALLGFGLDSVIETLASVVVIWRFTGHRRLSEHAEQRAQRLVAVSFFLIAPYLAQDAIRTLIAGDRPSISAVGISLSISSLILMPSLARAKQRLGSRLGSAATAGEGTQNMLCALLAAGVLVGLALNAAAGLWWVDPVVALVIAALAINEGRETWSGDGCCASVSIAAGQPAVCGDEECCAR